MENIDKSLLSIITVCYNSEKTIEKALNSVLNQTYDNYEYIVVDGRSNDATVSIIRKYEQLFNGKMRYVSEKDQGIYDAMNKGIRMCKGQVIGILNSDDFYEENALAAVVENMQDLKLNPYQVIYGMIRTIKDGVEENVTILSHYFIHQRMIAHPACFITKALYNEFGLYNTRYRSSADYEFMLRIADSDKVRFTPVYEILTNYVLGGYSNTRSGYLDKIRMLCDKKMISKKKYLQLRIIDFIKMIFRF